MLLALSKSRAFISLLTDQTDCLFNVKVNPVRFVSGHII